MKKSYKEGIERVIKELEKLKDKYLSDRDRYEVAESSARVQKEFWQSQVDGIQTQIEGHKKTLPKQEPAQV